ncbi:hypothetical protein BC827DRAFT_225583 [Russula dissimulans]|nr:hypothetical protein BC827DRAFT_225583 [Russula dissimulans]
MLFLFLCVCFPLLNTVSGLQCATTCSCIPPRCQTICIFPIFGICIAAAYCILTPDITRAGFFGR